MRRQLKANVNPKAAYFSNYLFAFLYLFLLLFFLHKISEMYAQPTIFVLFRFWLIFFMFESMFSFRPDSENEKKEKEKTLL